MNKNIGFVEGYKYRDELIPTSDEEQDSSREIPKFNELTHHSSEQNESKSISIVERVVIILNEIYCLTPKQFEEIYETKYNEKLTFDEAFLLVDKLPDIEKEPSRLILLGRAYLVKKEWDKTKATTEKAIEIDPTNYNYIDELHRHETMENLSTKKWPHTYERTEARILNAIQILQDDKANSIPLLKLLGKLHCENPQKIEKAIIAWTTVIKFESDSTTIFEKLVKVFARQGDLDNAIKYALLSWDDNGILGELYRRKGDFKNMYNYYVTRKEKPYTDKQDILYQMAIACYYDKNYEEVIKICENDINLNNVYDTIRYNFNKLLGDAYSKIGKLKEAQQCFQKAIIKNFSYPNIAGMSRSISLILTKDQIIENLNMPNNKIDDLGIKIHSAYLYLAIGEDDNAIENFKGSITMIKQKFAEYPNIKEEDLFVFAHTNNIETNSLNPNVHFADFNNFNGLGKTMRIALNGHALTYLHQGDIQNAYKSIFEAFSTDPYDLDCIETLNEIKSKHKHLVRLKKLNLMTKDLWNINFKF